MNKLIEALVRKDTPSDVKALDFDNLAAALDAIHRQFVDDRVRGFINPRTGQPMEPVSPEEAESRWEAVAPRWREALLQASAKDDRTAYRFGLNKAGQYPKSSDYSYTPDEPEGA